MSRIVILSGGFRAVTNLERGIVEWVPEGEAHVAVEHGDGTHVSRRTWAKGSARVEGGPVRHGNVVTRVAKVEKCPDCGSMRPAGARYHAPLLRTREAPHCQHGTPYYTACVGQRVLPPCCWDEEAQERLGRAG